ncbi:MAG: BMP family ABC transporter substrate-binding protein [Anaerolineae bacterium]
MKTRRWLLAGLLSAMTIATASCDGLGPPVPAREEPFKVAYVYAGAVGEAWSYAHDLGRQHLEEALDYVETAYAENVPEGPEAERVFRDYAEFGYDMIFATSLGYIDSVMEVAADHPEVLFEHCTGDETARNVSTYDGRSYEAWYLAGITAGLMTESNILGYVAPYPIPKVVLNLNAFALGARSVNVDAEVHPVWVMDWFNPPEEREAAQALLDIGADVIARETSSTQPDQLAQENGVYAIGYHPICPEGQDKVAPDAVLAGLLWDWGVYYQGTVEKAHDDEWAPHSYWGHLADGIVDLGCFGKMVPQDVQGEVGAARQEIMCGDLHPFAGPIRDSNGELRVADGETMTDDALLSFNWLVDGVVGQIPD